MVTLRQLRAGATLDAPIYMEKRYVVIGIKEKVVLATADTIEELIALYSCYDDCEVDIRRHDMYLNNNKKIAYTQAMTAGTTATSKAEQEAAAQAQILAASLGPEWMGYAEKGIGGEWRYGATRGNVEIKACLFNKYQCNLTGVLGAITGGDTPFDAFSNLRQKLHKQLEDAQEAVDKLGEL